MKNRQIYYVQWIDTVGKSKKYNLTNSPKELRNRPKEVWCTITSINRDTIGYYRGLSTPCNFVGFQSKDSLINLNFSIGINIFSEIFKTEKKWRVFFEENKTPVDFAPVQVNLKKDLRKNLRVVLIEK